MDDSSDYCRELILIGRTGNGKSCLGNSILGRKAFAAEELSMDSVTEMYKQESDNATYVIDTPGLFDTKNSLTDTSLEILSSLKVCPNPHAFIMVFNAKNRMTNEEKVTVNLLRTVLGETCFSNMIVVFTHVDENVSDSEFNSFWNKNDLMRQFIEKCGGRVCRIDNGNPAKEKRVLEILRLVDTVSKYGKNSFDSSFKTQVENVLKNHKANNEAMQTNIPNGQFSEIDVYGSEIQKIAEALASYLILCADNQTYQPVENKTDRTIVKTPVQPVANSTVQAVANPTVQTGADPTVRAGADPTVRTGADPTVQTGADPTVRTGADPTVQTGAVPIGQTGADPTDQTGADPTDQTGADPTGRQPGADPEAQRGAYPQAQTGADPAAQPGTDPTDSSSLVTYMFGLACVAVGVGCPAGISIYYAGGKIAGCIITGTSACVALGCGYYLSDKIDELMKTFSTYCQSISGLRNIFCCCS